MELGALVYEGVTGSVDPCTAANRAFLAEHEQS
jgi:hypothetical protein